MIRRPPRSTQSRSSAASDVYKRQVSAMVRICIGAEKHPSMHQSKHRMHESMGRVDEAIALSTMYAANHLNGIAAIICLTETGATPRLMSSIKSSLPIYALSRHHTTQHRVVMYRGVQTVPFDTANFAAEDTNTQAAEQLVKQGVVKDGDLVIITK